jgi:hypothetical protein
MSANGKLTSDELSNVGGMQLANSTARAWEAMVDAAKADGITLAIVRPAGAYRSYFVQGDMKKNPSAYNLSTASSVAIAGPGYSTHGLGNAVDVSACTGARLAWMLKNGPRFGFTRTFGARDPNHFGHDGTVPTLTPASSGGKTQLNNPEEDTLSKEDADRIISEVNAEVRKSARPIKLLQYGTGWVWVDQEGNTLICPSDGHAMIADAWGFSQGTPIRTVAQPEFDFVTKQLLSPLNPNNVIVHEGLRSVASLDDATVAKIVAGISSPPVVMTEEQYEGIKEAARTGAEDAIKHLSFVTVVK